MGPIFVIPFFLLYQKINPDFFTFAGQLKLILSLKKIINKKKKLFPSLSLSLSLSLSVLCVCVCHVPSWLGGSVCICLKVWHCVLQKHFALPFLLAQTYSSLSHVQINNCSFHFVSTLSLSLSLKVSERTQKSITFFVSYKISLSLLSGRIQ